MKLIKINVIAMAGVMIALLGYVAIYYYEGMIVHECFKVGGSYCAAGLTVWSPGKCVSITVVGAQPPQLPLNPIVQEEPGAWHPIIPGCCLDSCVIETDVIFDGRPAWIKAIPHLIVAAAILIAVWGSSLVFREFRRETRVQAQRKLDCPR